MTFIRQLSAPAEFLLIVLLTLGVQTVAAIRAVVRNIRGAAPAQIENGNSWVLRTVALELATLLVTLWIGSQRGWPLATFGLDITWKLTAAGVVLFGGLLALATAYGVAVKALHIGAPSCSIRPGTTLGLVILLCVVNPFFEEAVFSGYFIHALQHLGMWPAVLVSAVFASFLHSYLGLNGATMVPLIRIAVGLIYWRWRELWPLIIAHSLADWFALRSPLPGESESLRLVR